MCDDGIKFVAFVDGGLFGIQWFEGLDEGGVPFGEFGEVEEL